MIFANGDSWTFGSEIASPELLASPGEKGYGLMERFKKGKSCHDPENDQFRIPRTWPARLADRLGTNFLNYAWPGRSNDSIVSTTINWVLNKWEGDPNDLIVVIGWSGFERRDVYFKDINDEMFAFTFWPSIPLTPESNPYTIPEAREYYKLLVSSVWNEWEILSRFVDQNFALHNFLAGRGIEHYFFNSFYVPRVDNSFHPKTWTTINVREALLNLTCEISGRIEPNRTPQDEIDRLLSQWDILSNVYLDSETGETFKSFIDKNLPLDQRYTGMHPSPTAHDCWAQRLYDHIRSSQ